MIQLKQAVEEIVAPLPADPRLKDRYREELLRHLIELVEDEQAQGRDNVKALEVALKRLGNPETLRTDFTESLSRLDRVYGKACHAFEKRPDESGLRFALRGFGYIVLGTSLLAATLFLPAILGIAWFQGPRPEVAPSLSALGLFFVLYLSLSMFFPLLVTSRWDRALKNKEWGVYALFGFLAVLMSILAGAVGIGIGYVLLVWSLGSHHPEVYVFVFENGLVVFVTTVGIIAALTIGVFYVQPRIYSPLPDWPYRSDA